MPWSLLRFDEVVLPDNDPQPDFTAGPVESAIVDSIGGAFSYYGTRQRLPRRQNIQISGKYIGENSYLVTHTPDYLVDHDGNRFVVGSPTGQLRAFVEALTGKLGVRGSLWRQQLESPTTIQWKTARLLQIGHQRKPELVATIADLSLTFETVMAAWRAEVATVDSLGSGNGLRSLAVTNTGNVQVDDAVIAITAVAAVSSVRVQRAAVGADWTWTGTLAIGQTITVDSGAQTVRIGSTNAYSGFTLGSGHTARSWLPISPGSNNISITTDADATVTLTHYDQFL